MTVIEFLDQHFFGIGYVIVILAYVIWAPI